MPSNKLQIFPPVIAHRGASALAPENTMASFLKAKQLGLTWVEFDVTLATCGEVVVFHDEELSRTSNGIGKLTDQPYRYLKTLDAGSWFSPEFKEEKIPTLQEVLSFLSENNMAANIEIKPFPGCEDLVVKRVLEVIQKNKEITILISSFSYRILELMRKQVPQIDIQWLMDEWQEDWKKQSEALNVIAMGVNQLVLDQNRVMKIKKNSQLSLFSYTVNDFSRARELFFWGVDAIYSDCSYQLIQSLSSY